MNKENILRVADAIEAGRDDLGFNMTYWDAPSRLAPDRSGRGCGTTACIGGWASFILDGDLEGASTMRTAELFGLDYLQTSLLTCTEMNATDKEAVRTLRHLAETGFVNWDLEPDEMELRTDLPRH